MITAETALDAAQTRSPASSGLPAQTTRSQETRSFAVPVEAIFWGLLVLYECFLFFIPLFPNVDGPVHLYLSSIFWQLATHTPSIYANAYEIRHVVQPYTLHYYALLALGHWFSQPVAEKIVVGLIWLVLATGFRALTRALDPAALSPACLLVFPLLFSWPMGGGFFNYTLSTGLLLFALAFYLALPRAASPARNLAWLLLVDLALVMSHPLPLLILIVLITLDLLFQIVGAKRRGARARLHKAQVSTLFFLSASFAVPVLIADKAAVAQSVAHGFRPHLHYLKLFCLGDYLSYFGRAGAAEWIARLLLLAVFPAVIAAFALKGRSDSTQEARRLLLCALVYLALTFVMPGGMNGSSFFAIRMWFAVWLVVSACAAGLRISIGQQRRLAVFGGATALLFLALGFLYLRPIAARQALLYGMPLPQHARGLFLRPVAPRGGLTTTWPLGSWDGVRAFSAHQDVLLNTPWFGQTIIPVKPHPNAAFVFSMEGSELADDPGLLYEGMRSHPEKKQVLLAASDFLLFSDELDRGSDPLQAVSKLLGADMAHWSCREAAFSAVCVKQ